MSCPVCKRDVEIHAKGLCGACYQRFRKKGTTEYLRKGKYSICSIKGCEKRAIARGLCGMHRQRLRRHGSTDQTRPDSWGAITKHPLYHSWSWLKRTSAQHPVCDEWLEDFLSFAIDVGDRPSPRHKLFRIHEDQPIGPDNFTWRLSVTEKRPGESQKEYAARVNRVFRKLRQEDYAGYDLKKMFGLSYEKYEKMLLDQGGVCAICGQEELMRIRGKKLRLAVDHCHDTGRVRGLLCTNCNRGLGHFKDDPIRLYRAISYLSA